MCDKISRKPIGPANSPRLLPWGDTVLKLRNDPVRDDFIDTRHFVSPFASDLWVD
jgi:hypothetical protein